MIRFRVPSTLLIWAEIDSFRLELSGFGRSVGGRVLSDIKVVTLRVPIASKGICRIKIQDGVLCSVNFPPTTRSRNKVTNTFIHYSK